MNRLHGLMQRNMFVLTPRLITHPFDRLVGIYNCFFNTSVVLGEKEYKIFSSLHYPLDHPILQNTVESTFKKVSERVAIYKTAVKLLEKKFILSENVTDKKLVKAVQNRLSQYRPRFNTLCIVPSLKCNFSCSYCYHLSSFQHVDRSVISFNHIKKGISLLLNNIAINDYPIIRFIGGEPLIHKGLIGKTVEYVRRLDGKFGDRRPHFALITNGSLITPELATYLKINDFSVGVSLDGCQPTNDICRILKDKTGTYDLIMKGIEHLKRRAVLFSIGITLGKHNIDRIGDDIAWLAKNVSRRFAFNFMNDFFEGSNNNALNYSELAQKLRLLYDICDKYGVRESKMMERTTKFQNEEPFLFNCLAMSRQIVLSPYGTIGPCHHLIGTKSQRFFIRSVRSAASLYKTKVWKGWIRRTPVLDKYCSSTCKYFTFCGGGCAAESVAKNGTINIDKTMCNLAKFYLERLLEKRCVGV